MSRDLTTAVQNQLSADELQPFFAVKLNFDSGDLRLWTGYGDITVDSETYTGGGQLLNISQIEETVEIAARGITFSLNGVDSSLVSLALNENYQTRSAKLFLGVFSSGAVVSSPYELFDGRMDVLSIDDSGDTATITMTAESRLIDLERPRLRRYTSEDQKLRHPNDTGLDFVAALQEKEIAWGTGKDSVADYVPNNPVDMIPFNL
tara:strand:+ start:1881 stop:2498 length:618 start_codon:yes stop_codon:yes gene_type:complete